MKVLKSFGVAIVILLVLGLALGPIIIGCLIGNAGHNLLAGIIVGGWILILLTFAIWQEIGEYL